MNYYTKLARESINYFLKNNKLVPIPPTTPKSLISQKAGTFVSLHLKPSNELRGCIGTFLPTKSNVAEEIIHNAVAAATEDPRFLPLTLDELPKVEISVDILSSPKLVSKTTKLDPKKTGLIVSSSDGRRGLLLPDIGGVETVAEQERICRLKAGISATEPISRHYFTVKRFHE